MDALLALALIQQEITAAIGIVAVVGILIEWIFPDGLHWIEERFARLQNRRKGNGDRNGMDSIRFENVENPREVRVMGEADIPGEGAELLVVIGDHVYPAGKYGSVNEARLVAEQVLSDGHWIFTDGGYVLFNPNRIDFVQVVDEETSKDGNATFTLPGIARFL